MVPQRNIQLDLLQILLEQLIASRLLILDILLCNHPCVVADNVAREDRERRLGHKLLDRLQRTHAQRDRRVALALPPLGRRLLDRAWVVEPAIVAAADVVAALGLGPALVERIHVPVAEVQDLYGFATGHRLLGVGRFGFGEGKGFGVMDREWAGAREGEGAGIVPVRAVQVQFRKDADQFWS